MMIVNLIVMVDIIIIIIVENMQVLLVSLLNAYRKNSVMNNWKTKMDRCICQHLNAANSLTDCKRAAAACMDATKPCLSAVKQISKLTPLKHKPSATKDDADITSKDIDICITRSSSTRKG